MRIRELDGLRGIAVLAVLLNHYLPWAPITGSNYGWLGVDLFFILSGFLITSILLDLRSKPHYFRVFYSRRALRIFPPYLIGLAIYITYSMISGLHGTWDLWLQYVFYYTSLFLGQPKALMAVPPVIPRAVGAGLAVLWTLSVEEIFYTIWAPIVRYLRKPGLMLTIALMILLPPFLRWHFHTPKFPEIFTFYCRMDGLAYGAVVAFLVRLRNRNLKDWGAKDAFFNWAALIIPAISVIYWVALHGNQSSAWITSPGLVLADVSFALITFYLIRFAGSDRLSVRTFRMSWLRSVGMVSYSLYLFNYPVRFLTADWVATLHLSTRFAAVLAVVIGIPISLAIAYGLWYGVERHILRMKDKIVPAGTSHAQMRTGTALMDEVTTA
ncbi:acyltransferase family protein [Acidicapsa dinghuensis]|uniref:Acyltransferase family protein n=1 Tax=Acidicapsa dinghuensis TaxID=2218256 RepID=A0ABW1EM68_9BACT|nr:acyltransferase [Acidicapsa dinghuensis]